MRTGARTGDGDDGWLAIVGTGGMDECKDDTERMDSPDVVGRTAYGRADQLMMTSSCAF